MQVQTGAFPRLNGGFHPTEGQGWGLEQKPWRNWDSSRKDISLCLGLKFWSNTSELTPFFPSVHACTMMMAVPALISTRQSQGFEDTLMSWLHYFSSVHVCTMVMAISAFIKGRAEAWEDADMLCFSSGACIQNYSDNLCFSGYQCQSR